MLYVPALPPRAHQIEARKRIELARSQNKFDAFALLMDMGTGKSKVICDEFGERATANDASDLLIMAPAGCYMNWCADRGDDDLSEFHKQLDPAFYDRLKYGAWISNGGAPHKRRIDSLIRYTDGPRALVVNVEAMSRVEKARDACREFIRSSRRGVIFAIDESTTIKGEKSARTEMIVELGQEPKVIARRILTGLVTPNSPLDLFSQFLFLDWRILGFRSFVGFRARYAWLKKLPEHVVGHKKEVVFTTGFKNLEELNEKIAPHNFRVLKEECLDLPPKEYVSRDVELTKQQEVHYRELKKYGTTELAKEQWLTPEIVLALRVRLDQILCGFTVDDDKQLHEIPENRTKMMMEYLADYQGKAVIWTTHDYSIRKIAAVLRKEYGPNSTAMFWGGNRDTRHVDERRFKSDPNCRFMAATQSAGGRGNTWTMAGLSLYYNNDDNLEHRAQSEDRTHRDGLQIESGGAGMALYCDLIARGTLDERKIHNLRNKIDLAASITGEPRRDWLI
jgi:hypothetical protein